MTRTERRAAEHLARKAAYKALKLQNSQPQPPQPQPAPAPVAVAVPTPEAQPQPKSEISEARLTANRANAHLSTGPVTEAGKARCSQNAVKTALTGQTVVLPTDDVERYQALGQQLIDQYKPVTPQEERVVQCLIDAEWRLIRIPTIESGILAAGREELADSSPASRLEADVHMKQERSLRNLFLQENRIRRNREKDLKELKTLQTARREEEEVLVAMAKINIVPAPPPPQPASPEVGFEFETCPAASNTAPNAASKAAA